jgi:phosphatidylglycerol:prolipoprotein diacylglycerol transferase
MFPAFDPVLVTIGPLAIRWYALAYLAGFVLGWLYGQKLAAQNPKGPSPKAIDDFLTWAVIGTVLGGRIGYILFYQFGYYLSDPLEMFKVWHGGMSFHGGMLGVIAAIWLFTKREKIPFFAFSDILACVTPIGLGLGRLANFVNGELFGRPTDVPWAMIFPRGGDVPRHPSQLYEAGLEGLVLFLILYFLARRPWVRERVGLLSGSFLTLYGLFRFTAEFFREPDPQLGFLFDGATMGQLLCLPMIAVGGCIIFYALNKHKKQAA